MTSDVCTFAGCRMFAIAYGRCVRHVADVLATVPERDGTATGEVAAPIESSSVVQMEAITHES